MGRDRRVLPHNVEAEASILGGIILRNEVLSHLDTIEVEDFYDNRHKVVFQAIRNLEAAAKPIDVVTLEVEIEKAGKLDAIGGVAFLGELTLRVPTVDNVVTYAEIVTDKHQARKLMLAAGEISERGYEDNLEVRDYLDDAEAKIFEVTQRKAKAGPEPIKSLVKKVFSSLDERFKSPDGITGVPSGFVDLDTRTAGLQPTELIILAARPAMGKTAFSLNMAEYAAMKTKRAVAVFSMEMSASQLAFRLISSVGRINQQHLRNGDIQEEEWPRVTSAITLLSEAKIFIDDTPALSPGELRARCRRLKREHDLGLIVIDYLQLMQVPGNRENRATEISEISRNLKALAKELHVPVIALSQLNRSLEQRADKRPVMADLRESGAIEQDADVIMFIYRDEYYNQDSPDKGLAEIIIGKQRSGPTGSVKLTFLGQYTKFENYASDNYLGSYE